MRRAKALRGLEDGVSHLVHRVSNHLAGISGFAQLLLERDLEEAARRDAEVILKEAQKAIEVVREMASLLDSLKDSVA